MHLDNFLPTPTDQVCFDEINKLTIKILRLN